MMIRYNKDEQNQPKMNGDGNYSVEIDGGTRLVLVDKSTFICSLSDELKGWLDTNTPCYTTRQGSDCWFGVWITITFQQKNDVMNFLSKFT